MLGKVNGNYELEIAVIDLDKYEEIVIGSDASDEDFLSVAEELGTVYTLGGFVDKVNNQELDNLTNSYIRGFLINTENPEEIISIDDFNTLYVYCGEIKQR